MPAMIDWLIVRATHRPLLLPAFARAWHGGEALVTDLVFGHQQVVFVAANGCAARRAAHWPDVLVEWHEIYDEPFFPSDLLPVLAEEVSGLGADALVAHGELGLNKADIGWYEKGGLRALEHVGSSQVAWTPDGGLGRPFDGKGTSIAALGGALAAKWAGANDITTLFERRQLTQNAEAEAVLTRAMLLMLDGEPPAMDALAGMVALGPTVRVRL